MLETTNNILLLLLQILVLHAWLQYAYQASSYAESLIFLVFGSQISSSSSCSSRASLQ